MGPDRFRIYRFGEFELDLKHCELRKRGIKQKLAHQPFEVLRILVEHPLEVVTREELRRQIWLDNTFVDYDLALKKAVNRLRELLGDSAENSRLIQTVPRQGYRFIASVELLNPDGREMQLPSAMRQGISRERAQRTRQKIWASAVVLFCIAVVFIGDYLLRKPKIGIDHPAIHSIAVLPLANVSGDASQDFFAEGMTDALITKLAQMSSVRVISRTSIMQYRTTKKTLPEIGRELNVDAVVEGTVARSAKRVRINAQLLQASSDRHLWAEAYERDLGDVLTLQDEVAGAIASQIQARIASLDTAAKPPHSVDPAAYDLYLRARYEWNSRTADGMSKALALFNRAIAADPGYAPAYVGLAETYLLLPYYGSVAPLDAMPRGKAAALQALQIDNNLAEAHNAVAYVQFRFDRDPTAAEHEFKRALELNPNYATAHEWYALLLATERRSEEAELRIRTAESLDPLSAPISADHALILYYDGRYAEALEYSRQAIAMHPDFFRLHWVLGLVYEHTGDMASAVAEFEKAASLSHNSPVVLASLGHALAQSGDRKQSRMILAGLQELSKRQYVASYFPAVVEVGLGAGDQALRSLRRACDERYVDLPSLNVDHRFDALRSDRRFQNVVDCAAVAQ